MPLLNFEEHIDLSGYTIIIPSVSVANVPQLTVDLFITTLKMKNIATLWHPGLVPSIGSDPFYLQSKAICTACELYANDELKVATIQFRSTIETKLISKFVEDLSETLTSLKIKEVFILSSGFDYELHNIVEKDKFYFSTNNSVIECIMKATSAKVLEKNSNDKLIIPGSGFAIKFFEVLSSKMNCTIFVMYVSEGENIHDAQIYVEKLFKVLNIKIDVAKFTYPASWRYVYGAPPPIGLF